MFCPKCGIENPNEGKFCRSCGANLSNVLAVVDGSGLSVEGALSDKEDIAELHSTGVRNVILGIGFFAVSLVIYSIPGDSYFWVLLLFPTLALIASGARRLTKAEVLKQERAARLKENQPSALAGDQTRKELPPTAPAYIKPQRSIYATEDLAPAPHSVVENTTRHLEINSEGETVNLPQK